MSKKIEKCFEKEEAEKGRIKMNKKETKVQWGSIEDFNCKGNEKFFGIHLKNENGVFLGKYKGKDLVENSKTHILGIIPKRSGQGASVVIPTLAEYWKESAFIFDVNGESYQMTSGARKNNLDNMILRFAPFEKESQGFNPFEEVRFLTDKEEKDVSIISEALFSETDDKAKFKNLDNLFKALVFQSFFEKSLPAVSVSDEIKISNPVTFDFLYEKLNNDLDYIFAKNEKISEKIGFLTAQYWHKIYNEKVLSKHPLAQKYFKLFSLCSDKEQKEAVNELKNILNVFTEKNLKKNTQKSDFSVTDLVNYSSPVSLYYVIHMNDLKNDAVAGIMVSQIIYRATEEIPEDFEFLAGNNYRCLLVMNDFAKISKIPLYEEAMSYMMSYGLKSLIFVESISDFKRKYSDDDVNYFLSNSQTQLFYGTSDIDTINYVDSLLGADSNEAAKLSPVKGILKVAGKKPLLVDKVVFFLEKRLNELAKIPAIISESLRDKDRMYLKTDSKELAFKYVPSRKIFGVLREKLEKIEAVLNLAANKKEFLILKNRYEFKFKQYEDYRQEYNKQFIPKIERYFKKNYSDSDGLAGWMPLKELQKMAKTKTSDEYFDTNSILEEKGVILGKFDENFLIEPLTYKGHIAFISPSAENIVIPTLLKTWEESVFVLDIDGKSYQLTSGSRKENLNNYILRFSPFSENSCKWNPLSEIRLMSSYETADIELVANIICGIDEARGNDRYWTESSKELLVGLLTYFLYKKFLKNPKYIYGFGRKIPVTDIKIEDIEEFFKDIKNSGGDIQEVLKEMSEENLIEKYGENEEIKNIVKKYLSSEYGNKDNVALQNALSEGKHPIAAKYLLNSSLLAKKTFASVLGTLVSCLAPFMVKSVRENMQYSDFRMIDLVNSNKPVSFYFHIPAQQTLKYKSLTKLFIEQMFAKLLPENEDKIENEYRYKMLMLLDNFTAFGKIEAFEKIIGYAASYGIKMLYTFPSISALNKTYGKANGILSNCNTQIFGVSNDELTAKYVSGFCGKTTAEQHVSAEKVYIIKEEEFKNLPKNRLIIKRYGWKPIIAEKVKHYEENLFKEDAKLPFAISESLIDISKQYLKLSAGQKGILKEHCSYNFNYLPSKFAISQIEKRLEDMKKEIDKMTKSYSELDDNDIEKYNYLVRSYSSNLSEINNAKNALNYFSTIKEQ